MTTPARPAMSGPGSSAAAWRAYAAEISGQGGWEDLTRDEIVTLLQEGGLLDKDGNPVEGASAVKQPVRTPAQADTVRTDQVSEQPESSEPPKSPPPAVSSNTPSSGPSRSPSPAVSSSAPSKAKAASPAARDTSGEGTPERGLVDEPCRKCYPQGWPTKQTGASASCHHGLTITKGESVEISREDAIKYGFVQE